MSTPCEIIPIEALRERRFASRIRGAASEAEMSDLVETVRYEMDALRLSMAAVTRLVEIALRVAYGKKWFAYATSERGLP